jgi:hypothetical protein
VLIAGIVAISSLAAAAFARYGCGARFDHLPKAARRMLAFLALWVLCLALNVALGIAAVLAWRAVSARFVSLYLVNDDSLLIFSALQASILHLWISASER